MNWADVRTNSARGLLALLALKGVGPASVERLWPRWSTLGAIFEADPASLRAAQVPSLVVESLHSAESWARAVDHADAALAKASAHDISVLSFADADYPMRLRSLDDRPPILYVKGTLRSSNRAVACVGTREPSRFGVEVTRRLAGFLAERQWSVVSGLALGVDALAHQAALDAKGHTIAVLANGLDAVYPKKNAALADAILAAGGALISEQPIGAPAVPRNLVQRDRLQSGLSAGVIVMQTDIVGGTMHTVRFALTQHRRLFVPVPPSGDHRQEPKSRGLLALVEKHGRELAKLLNASSEYARILEGQFGSKPVATALHGRGDYDVLLSALEKEATLLPSNIGTSSGSTGGVQKVLL